MNLPALKDSPYPPDCSIVLPVYFNEGCLWPLYKAIEQDVLRVNPQRRFEIIFVDDGSGDKSLDELLEIRDANPGKVKVVKLSRNFGQSNALAAGFVHSQGRCVVALSADGQDPPQVINDMLRAHFDEKYDIVLAARSSRDESFYRRCTSRLFYWVIQKLTFPQMPIGGFDFVLMSRRVVVHFLQNRDINPFFQGQILWLGFKRKFIEYHRQKRITGESQYSFWSLVTYLIDGVMAYSFFPIRLISGAGIALAFFGFIYAVIIFVTKLILGIPIKGWAPLMIVILILGGFQMLMLGVLGEYLWRTLAQTRNRDWYIVDSLYE